MTQLRLGLTGGIGAGKSTVSRALGALGARIIDADLVAREVVEPGQPALAALVEAFGPDILGPEGALDRGALARVAFADAERTATLGAIVHPAVAERTAELMSEAKDAEILVHDVPLLVENHLEANYHLTLLVDAPADARLERLVRDRGMDPDDARARIARQADDAARYAACDIVLDNSGDQSATLEALRTLARERLVPFARNLAQGVPTPRVADPRGDTSPDAVRRIVARLERALERAGEEGVDVSAREAGGVVAVRVGAGDAGQATRLGPLVARAGYPQDPAGEHRSADPAQPVDVSVEVRRS